MSEGAMIIQNVEDVNLEGYDRGESSTSVTSKLKKIVSSVIGKKKEDPKIKKTRKEDNKQCYSKEELVEIIYNY